MPQALDDEKHVLPSSLVDEPSSSGVALVTTLLLPAGGAGVLESFVRWHLAIGIERLYLCFDDESSETPVGWKEVSELVQSIKYGESRVIKYRRSEIEWEKNKRFTPYVDAEVQARQVLNAEYVFKQAMTAGLRWLLHLDVDEAFYASSRAAFLSHFAQLEADDIGHCTYANHEGIPPSPTMQDDDDDSTQKPTDYFSGVTLFRVNHLCAQENMTTSTQQAFAYWKQRTRHAQFLLCYDNGKSAVRLVDGCAATSVHNWHIPSHLKYRTALTDARNLDLGTIDPGLRLEPCILHYVVCGLFWLETKYRVLGQFENAWFGGALPIAPSFHLDARDIVMASNPVALRAFYDSHVAPPPDHILDDHIRAGVCRRYNAVASFLRQFPPANSKVAPSPSLATLDVVKNLRRDMKNDDLHNAHVSKNKKDESCSFERAWILSTAAQKFL